MNIQDMTKEQRKAVVDAAFGKINHHPKQERAMWLAFIMASGYFEFAAGLDRPLTPQEITAYYVGCVERAIDAVNKSETKRESMVAVSLETA